jgi:hypothetical protein
MMRLATAVALAMGSVAAALADDSTEGLNPCLDAAHAARPGVVVHWEVEDGTGRGFLIEMVAHDGSLWRLTCDPTTGALGRNERATGYQDFKVLSARTKVPEARARRNVHQYFPGRFIDMQVSYTWRGGAIYEYDLITADDREGKVAVDAATGRILSSRSSAN